MYIILPLAMLLVLIGLGLLFWLKVGVKSKANVAFDAENKLTQGQMLVKQQNKKYIKIIILTL